MKKRNWWKISFISLVTLILISIGVIGINLFSTPKNNLVNRTDYNNNDSVFFVNLNKKQFNRLSNSYIEELLDKNDIKYKFSLDDKKANLTGNIQFLNAKIFFKLVMAPKYNKHGDVLLYAENLKIGSLHVPIDYVMNYVSNAYHLPDWVGLNVKKKLISLHFSQLKLSNGYRIKVKKIDLNKNQIKVEVFKEDN